MVKPSAEPLGNCGKNSTGRKLEAGDGPTFQPSSSRRALVTGGTGALGPHLVARLIDAGYTARVFTRASAEKGLFGAEVEFAHGDIRDPDAVRAAMEGVQVVFHLAAKLHVNHPGPSLEQEYFDVNVRGTQVIADAATAAGVERIVFFSTIAVYGPSKPGMIHCEESPTAPGSLYAETKCAAEAIVLRARGADGQALGIVLRVAATYGTRIKGNYRQLVRWIRSGWFVPVGAGANRRTLVNQTDLVTAALLAAERPGGAGRVFNITDGHVYELREILAAIAQATGTPLPRWHLPARPVRTLAMVYDRISRAVGSSAALGPVVDKMLEDMAVSGEAAFDILGFRPVVGLRQGWAEVVGDLPGDRTGTEKLRVR